MNETQNSKVHKLGEGKKKLKCSHFTKVNNRSADELELQVSSFSIHTSLSSKVTLIRSSNHQQAGNTGEGEEELDNNLLSKADFIIIFTFLEKPGKYLLAYE